MNGTETPGYAILVTDKNEGTKYMLIVKDGDEAWELDRTRSREHLWHLNYTNLGPIDYVENAHID